MSVTLTVNRELPIPSEVWSRMGLHPGEEFEVIVEQDRLVAIRKSSREGQDFHALMARLDYVRAGRQFGRDEANER